MHPQRVDGYGTGLWAPTGVGVRTGTGSVYYLRGISDGQGGALLAWADTRSGNYDICVQRLNPLGVPQWTSCGVALATGAHNRYDLRVSADGGVVQTRVMTLLK